MSDSQGRFEFRIWGGHLEPLHERLRAIGKTGPAQESAETYILSRATDTVNLKIRVGLIDIKELVEQQDQLERWRPIFKRGFPIDSETIVENILPKLGVAPPPLGQTQYTHGEFIQKVVGAIRDLAAIDVTKTRRAFILDDCTAEFAIVRISAGAEAQTIAIESENAAAVLSAIAQIGLSPHTNVNYVRHLKLMIGMTPRVVE
jgi:exopolyphosphatase/guanosine-5'-triphosphate,3'-diphosphate pyrophosphatase